MVRSGVTFESAFDASYSDGFTSWRLVVNNLKVVVGLIVLAVVVYVEPREPLIALLVLCT